MQISGCKETKTQFQLHALSEHHLIAMSKSSEYNSPQKSGSVVEKTSTAHQKYIQENREYIKCLIDICLYFGRQGISFCGYCENDESLNEGDS